MSKILLNGAALAAVFACAACVYVPTPAQTVTYATPAPVVQSAPQVAQNCREFQQTVNINGQPERAYGLSCQQPDGSWKIVSERPQPAPVPPPVEATSYPVYPAYPYYYGYPRYYGPSISLGFGFGSGGRHWHRR